MTVSPCFEVTATEQNMLGMSYADFLRDYWQQKPLLIRQAFKHFSPPLSPDDLGGLSLEDSALSRLIEYHRETDDYCVHTGPMDEEIYTRLPDHDWTLLVQDVDKWDNDVAQLLSYFAFLPQWRIDDIMVSYAEDQGGVGAHVDHYDVFLLQGLGKRRWRIDTSPDPDRRFKPDVALKQLVNFEPTHEWVLEPGDMLYLPPGVPHDGVAIGQCMTYSIGMRAPSHGEMMLDLVEHISESMGEEPRYQDPDSTPALHIGEIDQTALLRVKQAVASLADLLTEDQLHQWFGRFITQYRVAQYAAPPPAPYTHADMDKAIARQAVAYIHPWTRMAWIRDTEDAVNLFVAGDMYLSNKGLASKLCQARRLKLTRAYSNDEKSTLLELLNAGHLVLGHE